MGEEIPDSIFEDVPIRKPKSITPTEPDEQKPVSTTTPVKTIPAGGSPVNAASAGVPPAGGNPVNTASAGVAPAGGNPASTASSKAVMPGSSPQ